MNIFFVLDGTVITPPADGTILEGVTRASILDLAADLGYPTEVRPFSIHEWIDAATSDRLSEVFASGTAAVVTPIRELVADTQVITTPTPGLGPIAARLHHELTGIQFGTIPDRFGWMQPVGEPQ